MSFDFFVLPFFCGLLILFGILGIKYSRWMKNLSSDDKLRIAKGLFTRKSLLATKEVFMESLLHRKMFLKNPMLGYMHMSFAFGWFMLILLGNLESRIYSKVHINPPYYPIFLKYFVHDHRVLTFELSTVPGFFRFAMDFFLLIILIGLILALFKRASSNWFGMKNATKHSPFDRMAMTALWLIFPMRLLAESFTAGQFRGGGFLTNHLGIFFANILPVEYLSYPAWWGYSIVLGVFLVTMPYSRFMHIPTEVLLIFFRHYGIKANYNYNGFSEIEVHSCPRCGVCLDACPVHAVQATPTPPVYYFKSIRYGNKEDERSTFDCLLCGRCKEYCPVGIDNNMIRVSQRIRMLPPGNGSFEYLRVNGGKTSDIVYFAGCMTHLTPGIKKSMVNILELSGVHYQFIDEDGSICCGRPMMISGKEKQARVLIDHNREAIKKTSCSTLVTSCPICYKFFNEEYGLDIEVLHHSQYLLRLYQEGKVNLKRWDDHVSFHDPCELGRGSGIYEEPREVIGMLANLVEGANVRTDSICCGGSLGSLDITGIKRDEISKMTVDSLKSGHPDKIITACPLCKKTLHRVSDIPVIDIAELFALSAIPRLQARKKKGHKLPEKEKTPEYSFTII